jgi:AcrR family transcriptional regulator
MPSAMMLPVSGQGLRDLKKARTRRLIADVAARLFAEHGYEHVTVTDVAREAEVSEQTVYNYFPSKEHLVTDRDQQVQEQLVELIRARGPGVSPAAAIRDYVLATVDGIPSISPDLWRGEPGYLAVLSPAVHRLSLEMTDRHADAIAAAISDTTTVLPEVAKLRGIAIGSVFQTIFTHAGRRTHEGRSQTEIAGELRPIIEAILDELDRWLSLTERPSSGAGATGRAVSP